MSTFSYSLPTPGGIVSSMMQCRFSRFILMARVTCKLTSACQGDLLMPLWKPWGATQTTAGIRRSPAWSSCSGWPVVHPTVSSPGPLICPEHPSTVLSTPPVWIAKIASLFAQTVNHPTEEELVTVGGSAAFNRVVGSIDGCHVRVKPPSQDADCYLNRKLFYSVQLQAVVDQTAKFLDVCLGYTGSVHDSRVLKNSPLYLEKHYPPPGYCLIGDGWYPCLSYPMTPYRQPADKGPSSGGAGLWDLEDQMEAHIYEGAGGGRPVRPGGHPLLHHTPQYLPEPGRRAGP